MTRPSRAPAPLAAALAVAALSAPHPAAAQAAAAAASPPPAFAVPRLAAAPGARAVVLLTQRGSGSKHLFSLLEAHPCLEPPPGQTSELEAAKILGALHEQQGSPHAAGASKQGPAAVMRQASAAACAEGTPAAILRDAAGCAGACAMVVILHRQHLYDEWEADLEAMAAEPGTTWVVLERDELARRCSLMHAHQGQEDWATNDPNHFNYTACPTDKDAPELPKRRTWSEKWFNTGRAALKAAGVPWLEFPFVSTINCGLLLGQYQAILDMARIPGPDIFPIVDDSLHCAGGELPVGTGGMPTAGDWQDSGMPSQASDVPFDEIFQYDSGMPSQASDVPFDEIFQHDSGMPSQASDVPFDNIFQY